MFVLYIQNVQQEMQLSVFSIPPPEVTVNYQEVVKHFLTSHVGQIPISAKQWDNGKDIDDILKKLRHDASSDQALLHHIEKEYSICVPCNEQMQRKNRYYNILPTSHYAVQLGDSLQSKAKEPYCIVIFNEKNDSEYDSKNINKINKQIAIKTPKPDYDVLELISKISQETQYKQYINASYIIPPWIIQKEFSEINALLEDNPKLKTLLENELKSTTDKSIQLIPRYYIACQAPTRNTLQDFWKMIIQNDIHTIVMLTRVQENQNEKAKALIYWPVKKHTVDDTTTTTTTTITTTNIPSYQQNLKNHNINIDTTCKFDNDINKFMNKDILSCKNTTSSTHKENPQEPSYVTELEQTYCAPNLKLSSDLFHNYTIEDTKNVILDECPSILFNDTLQSGDKLILYLLLELNTSDFIIRVIKLHINNKSIIKYERIVTQFQYIGWPDFGTITNFTTYSTFHSLVDRHASNRPNTPILVHCSAGVGRSGTFIAIDMFMNFLRGIFYKQVIYTLQNEPYISLKSHFDSILEYTIKKFTKQNILYIIGSIRSCRNKMVTTESQYIMVYSFLFYALSYARVWLQY